MTSNNSRKINEELIKFVASGDQKRALMEFTCERNITLSALLRLISYIPEDGEKISDRWPEAGIVVEMMCIKRADLLVVGRSVRKETCQ